MLGGDLEVPGVTEEPGELRGEHADQMSACLGIPFFRRDEQHIKPGIVPNPEPLAASVDELAMTVEQLNARQPQRQAPRACELFIR
jgi:hypothetical protein